MENTANEVDWQARCLEAETKVAKYEYFAELENNDPETRAKKAIVDYAADGGVDTSNPLEVRGLKTVWFAYILGGWKTLQFIIDEPGNYFEITYDSAKGRMYLDHYVKMHNEMIMDSSDYKMAQLRERLSKRER